MRSDTRSLKRRQKEVLRAVRTGQKGEAPRPGADADRSQRLLLAFEGQYATIHVSQLDELER